ncbi:MAG: hypothetical protein IIC53_00205 [Proteobacteria bacterium]|nr:hypothetical protein [Pseudomonadota bacterium]
MVDFFGPYSREVWVLILALALFFPVRQLIWALAVRRAEKRDGPTDEARRQSLKRRAAMTAALLSFVFAYFYTATLMSGR